MGLIWEARWVFLHGIANTALITVLAAMVALVMAFVAGLARLSPLAPVRWAALAYIEIFRGVSLLVQLFWLFFVMPFFGLTLEPITTAVIAIGLCNGAYGAEIVRSAIRSVPKGQVEAAVALNFPPLRRMTRVVLPQAIPTMLPPFGNLMIELLKATALVSLITIQDLSFQALTLRQTTMRTVEPFTVVLLGYFAMAMLITLGFRRLERRAGAGVDRRGL